MVSAPVVPGLDQVVAAWAHSGQAAALVRSLKYGRATAMVTEIADELAVIAPPADVVTWIPSTARHRRRRGFDPSELLARGVARRQGLRARRLIRRADDMAQTARDRAGRLAGPELVPAGRSRSPRPLRVLVVDDVCTTGSTLRAAAVALRRWGAGSVVAVVVTAVPPHDR
jgi:predicted amidophosphoribosyltransferase